MGGRKWQILLLSRECSVLGYLRRGLMTGDVTWRQISPKLAGSWHLVQTSLGERTQTIQHNTTHRDHRVTSFGHDGSGKDPPTSTRSNKELQILRLVQAIASHVFCTCSYYVHVNTCMYFSLVRPPLGLDLSPVLARLRYR